MRLIPFIADSAQDAVAQIRAALGAEAVVVNVRQVQPEGLARLWQKPRIEVLAYRPEPGGAAGNGRAPNQAQLRAFENGSQPVEEGEFAQTLERAVLEAEPAPLAQAQEKGRPKAGWRVGSLLETGGLLPLYAHRIVDFLEAQHGVRPPPTVHEEVALAQSAMRHLWRKPSAFIEDSLRPHVLVGPCGSGKTTVLCKWLAHLSLVQGRAARVWRLDGRTANTAEALSVHGEILGVPVERSWQVPDDEDRSEVRFIDLPGVDWRSGEALRSLNQQLKQYLSPHVHLVLNGAYDTSLLLAQVKAFACLPVEDLIVTHLDEETRWGKIWNLMLGTNYAVRFLSAGQNIPGEFKEATVERIFSRQFWG